MVSMDESGSKPPADEGTQHVHAFVLCLIFDKQPVKHTWSVKVKHRCGR